MSPTDAISRPASGTRSTSIFDWVELNWQKTLLAAGAIAAVAGGLYVYGQSKDRKVEGGDRAYYQAQQPLISGNLALAETQLRKVATQYDGTAPGAQAGLLLAQVQYDQQKYAEGVKTLEGIDGSSLPAGMESSRLAVLAAGYEEQRKFAQAADAYRRAADAAAFPEDKAKLEADEARSLAGDGKRDSALAIWRRLAESTNRDVAGEARIRVGELEAAAAR